MLAASKYYIIPKKEYKIENGDRTKTFSKDVEPEVGHTQPISNVLSPN